MENNTTMQHIIDSAFALFQDKGYGKTTVNDICKASGVTKTTFYYHLSSKDDVLTHFFDGVINNLASRMLHIIGAGNYWEQLVACFETLQKTTDKIGPALLSQMYIVNLKEDKGTFNLQQDMTELATTLIECAQSKGQIRNKSEPLQLYWAISHAFEGYDLLWCIHKGDFNRQEAFRYALEDICDVVPEFKTQRKAEDSPYPKS